MSIRIGDISIIKEEPPDICDLCGKRDELRPYGPNSELICWDCGQKNLEVTQRMMNRILFGDEDD